METEERGHGAFLVRKLLCVTQKIDSGVLGEVADSVWDDFCPGTSGSGWADCVLMKMQTCRTRIGTWRIQGECACKLVCEGEI